MKLVKIILEGTSICFLDSLEKSTYAPSYEIIMLH